MLKKYEYFCNMVNELRLADKKFKFEIERVYRIHGNGKARDTAAYRLNKKENEVQEFLQKAFKTPDFCVTFLRKNEDNHLVSGYETFSELCNNLAKAEKRYWKAAIDFNNRLVEFSEITKTGNKFSDAETKLNLFLNRVFNTWYNKSVNVEDLQVSV